MVYVINDLNGEENKGTLYKNKSKITNQSDGKTTIIQLIVGLINPIYY